MGFTDLTIRLLLLFFPGIVCHYFVDAMTVHRERKPHEVVLHSYIYGVFSYVIYAVFVALVGLRITRENGLVVPPPTTVVFASSLTDSKVPVDFLEIGYVTAWGIVLGVLVSLTSNRKWLFRIASRCRLTSKFGEPNVWSFAFDNERVKWAVVRDLEKNLMFYGYVRAFSDLDESPELLLTDVIVYDEKTGRELYKADSMYLCRKKDGLTVEFPNS